MSIDGADGFLKTKGVLPRFGPNDLDRDVATLEGLLGRGPSPE